MDQLKMDQVEHETDSFSCWYFLPFSTVSTIWDYTSL